MDELAKKEKVTLAELTQEKLARQLKMEKEKYAAALKKEKETAKAAAAETTALAILPAAGGVACDPLDSALSGPGGRGLAADAVEEAAAIDLR